MDRHGSLSSAQAQPPQRAEPREENPRRPPAGTATVATTSESDVGLRLKIMGYQLWTVTVSRQDSEEQPRTEERQERNDWPA
eukprot:1693360-Rhodomonas_salina.1